MSLPLRGLEIQGGYEVFEITMGGGCISPSNLSVSCWRSARWLL